MLFMRADVESGDGDSSIARGGGVVPASTASSPPARASTRRNPGEPAAESLAWDRTIDSNASASASSAARWASVSLAQPTKAAPSSERRTALFTDVMFFGQATRNQSRQ